MTAAWRRRLGHLALPLAAAAGVQLAVGRLGPIGLGEDAVAPEVLAVGAVVGSLYGLVGVGMVLVWRSHRLLNLAQAQLGAVPAVAALLLVSERGWPYVPAVLLALVLAAGLGVASERLVVRRFDDAPRLAATVATLGLAQVLVAVEILLPRFVAGIEGVVRTPSTPFSDWRHLVGVVTFTGDHLVAVVAGVGVSLLVAVGLRRTGLGLAVRATAARPVQAAQLGVPVRRIRAGVWAVAAVASAVAVLLRAPLVGFPVGGLVGPATLLFGLAAATLARFDDPVRALAAGIAVGIVEQGVVYGTGRAAAADIAVFVLIVLSLVVQREKAGRLAEVGAWMPAREVPPLPAALWGRRPVRIVRVVASVALAVTLVGLPLVLPPGQATRMTALCAFGVVAVATVVLAGWSGQLGLGQIGVAGVGAAVAGGLVGGRGGLSDMFLVLLLAGLAGAAASVAVGASVVRLAGPQLAIATLAFAFAVPAAMRTEGLTGWLLPDGPVVRPDLLGALDLRPEHRFTYVALGLLVVALALARRLRASRTGRLLLAARDDTRAAAAVGTEPWRVRLVAFAASGALAGAAGAVIAWNQGVVEAATFAPQRSLDIIAAVVIGGLSSLVGSLVGVLWVFGLPMLFPDSPYVAALGSGVGVLVVLLVQPGGLGVLAGRGWRWLAARLAGVEATGAARGGSRGRFAGIDRALEEAGRAPRPDRLIRRLEVDGGDDDGDDGGDDDDVAAPAPVAAVPVAVDAPMLAIDRLHVRRGGNVVLRDVSLQVGAGQCVALVGTNGAGKSTLLDAVAGGVRPQRGRVGIGGADVTGADPQAVAALGVAVHPGARACFPDLTVEEHFVLAARHLGGRAGLGAAELFDRYPRLRRRRRVEAGALSGGERHLLGFALAAMRRPDLLLVDELSLGLAPDVLDELVAALARFRADGCTIVVVDQRLEHLAGLADRAVFLERGEVRFDGPVEDLLGDDGLLRPALAAASAAPADRRGESGGLGPVALAVEGVSVSYGAVAAVTDVTLEVRAGEVVGLVGGNGAGKTTFLDAVAGHARHTGAVRLAGRDVAGLGPAARAAEGLARSFQAGSGLDALSVAECLALAQDRGMHPRSLAAAALGLPAAAAAETDAALRAELLAAEAGLLEWLDTPAGDLSTGLRRRLELHMVTAHDPTVVLLDEPTSGVAAAEIDGIVAVVHQLAGQGAAVVVVDHDHAFVGRVADRVVTLVDGHVTATTEGVPVVRSTG